MLQACASSPAPRPPEPIVSTKVERIRVCPEELAGPVPAKPVPAAGAVIRGNDAGLEFVAALGAVIDGLVDLLRDARAACPKGQG